MKLLISASLFLWITLVQGQSNWVPSGPNSNDNFTDITSSSNSTYFLTTYNPGKIYKSTNSGNSWSRVYISSSEYLSKVEFVNNQVGFAAGVTNNNYPVILRTTNAGASWTSSNIPGTFRLNNSYVADILFLNANNGYATCSNGSILETTDGGLNWQLINTNGGIATGAYEIIQQSSNTFFIAGAGSGTWLFNRTNNNMTRVGFHSSLSISKGVNDVFCLTPNEIAMFPNGGSNLTVRASNPLSVQVFPNILAISDSTIFICGNDRNIYRSDDGGNTLTQDLTPQNGSHLNEIDLLNGTIWTVGEGGQVFKRQLSVNITERKKDFEISLFPNPAKEFIWIKSLKSIDEVSVSDINGKAVITSMQPSDKIDISHLKSGIYFIRVISNGIVSSRKIVKQ